MYICPVLVMGKVLLVDKIKEEEMMKIKKHQSKLRGRVDMPCDDTKKEGI